MNTTRFLFAALLLVVSVTPACGEDAGADACARFEQASCSTDEACANTDPCSLTCDALGEPEDADALDTCVDELEAITLPGETVDPLGHAAACAQRSSKKLDCLSLF